MMHEEFERIAGYEVEYRTYKEIIEPMYMATELSKKEFVKLLDKKAFALPTAQELCRKMKKKAQEIFEKCGHVNTFDEEEELDRLAKEYAKRKYAIDWTHDPETYVFFTDGYEYPQIGRGCVYPRQLIIGRNGTEYERMILVKEPEWIRACYTA